MLTIRTFFLLIFIACTGLIATALYMEHFMGKEPCYMCILQRVFVIAAGAVALLAFLFNPGRKGTRIFASLTALMALGGSYFSSYQLWLQSLPEDQIPDCGATVSYLFEVQPFFTALKELLKGDGNCAEVQWTFLGLSIPGWMLICFLGLAGIAIWQFVRAKRLNR